MSYAALKVGKQVRIKVGSKSLLLATLKSDGAVINSSLDFNLTNELRRLFSGAHKPTEISLEVSAGKSILHRHHPEPIGSDIMEVADLIAARERIQSSLDLLMAANLPAWVAHEEEQATRIKLVELIEKYTVQIDLKLKESSDARHEEPGDVRPRRESVLRSSE